MTSITKASSDPPVDLEKGVTGLKVSAAGEENEVAVVDPCMAKYIKVTLDAVFVVYSLFLIGVTGWMFKVSETWWGPWLGVFIFSALLLLTFWLTSMVKDVYIRKYATKHTLASYSDVSTKLLASEK